MTWIDTHSGQDFDFLAPDASKIRDTDIASALSNISRFTGHTRTFYSVAQHSILVANLVPAEFAFYGLLHDAHEAYVGDISTPLQWALTALLPDFRDRFDGMRQQIDAAIWEYFMIPPPSSEARAAIKTADLKALAAERRDLMPKDGRAWDRPLPDVSDVPAIWPWTPQHAQEVFWLALQICSPIGGFSRWDSRNLFDKLRTLSTFDAAGSNAFKELFAMARECTPAT